MSRDLSYRVWDDEKKEYSDKPFSLDQYGLLYVQDEDGYWEEAGDRYIIEFSTGLKDKNVKEIYEGDIVRQFYDEEYYVVEFKYGGFLPFAANILTFDVDYCEVIGNIHENAELLEDKNHGE